MKQKVTCYHCNIWGWNFYSLSPEANLPTEATEQVPTTAEVNNDLFEQLQEAVQDGPKPQEVRVVDVQKAENQNKQKKRKITQEDIVEEQYKALIAKQENLKLKKKKETWIRSLPFGTKSMFNAWLPSFHK